MTLAVALLTAALAAGEATELKFSIPEYFQQIAAQGGNPRPQTGIAGGTPTLPEITAH